MVVQFTDLQGSGDILGNDRYKLTFGRIPGGGDAQTLSILCDHVGVPAQTAGHIRVNLLGYKVGFAGNDSSDTVLNASFYDNEKGAVLRALTQWRLFIQNRADHTSPLKREYAVNCGLRIYDTTGASALYFTLRNVFPISIQMGDLSETSGPLKHDVQFNVDEVFLLDSDPSTTGTSGASTNLSAADNSHSINTTPNGGGNSLFNFSSGAISLLQFADRFLR